MKKTKDELIQSALERAFRSLQESGPAELDARTRDFVFHMTDWQEDLKALSRLYDDPGKGNDAQWQQAIEAFLYHVVGHLLAAARLNGCVPDPFEARRKPTKRRPRAMVRK